MEVHHHPHVEKKSFKEYFLEGLMIFLAVSMGFIAENLREKIGDKERLHDYMLSITGDLKSDLALYDSTITINTRYSLLIDTVIETLNSRKGDMGKLYNMARRLTMGGSIIFPDSKTFEQMKSSGGLRLIHKQIIADSIAAYYLWIKKFDYWTNTQRERISELIVSNNKIYNARVFYDIVKNNPKESLPKTLALISSDPKDINEVIMRDQYYYSILKLMNQRALLASAQAKRLINLLQKEYHLENE